MLAPSEEETHVADLYVHPSRRGQGAEPPAVEAPVTMLDATEGELGELVATWRRRTDNVRPRTEQQYALKQRLESYELLLRTATPETDGVKLAAAAALIPVIERTLKAEVPARVADQESADAARAALEAAWQRLQALLRHWRGVETAHDRDGQAMEDEAVLLELARLLGDRAVPLAAAVRQRRAADQRARQAIDDR